MEQKVTKFNNYDDVWRYIWDNDLDKVFSDLKAFSTYLYLNSDGEKTLKKLVSGYLKEAFDFDT